MRKTWTAQELKGCLVIEIDALEVAIKNGNQKTSYSKKKKGQFIFMNCPFFMISWILSVPLNLYAGNFAPFMSTSLFIS